MNISTTEEPLVSSDTPNLSKHMDNESIENETTSLASRNVVVIVPAYNEERFIGSVILKLKKLPVTVMVVDDGSEDNTTEIAEAAGAVVHRLEKNQGKGAALNLGFQKARGLKPDAIVIIDADSQHLPEELPHLVAPILKGDADISIGSRYLKDVSNTPWSRRIGHKFINLATSLSSGIYVTDSQSGFRAFSPKAYDLIQFKSEGFSVESEMQFLAAEHNLRLVEVPITIRYSDKAKRPAVQQGMSVLNGILRLAGQYRPLLFFGIPGLLLLLTGIVWGLVVIQRYIATQKLATGYAMITVMLSVIGSMMMSTGFTLYSIRTLLIDMLKSDRRDPDQHV